MKSHGICDGCYECESYPPEPTGATQAAETAPPVPEDTPEVDEARVRRYAEAMHQAECRDGVQAIPDHEDWRVRIAACFQCIRRAEAAIAVDEEQAALRAEVEQLIRHPTHILERWMIGWYDAERSIHWINPRDVVFAAPDDPAVAAEAEVERLTRECLDREATETDARERLRRCEERLAEVEALHVRTPTDAGPDYRPECSEAAQEWVRWPCPTAAAVKSDQ